MSLRELKFFDSWRVFCSEPQQFRYNHNNRFPAEGKRPFPPVLRFPEVLEKRWTIPAGNRPFCRICLLHLNYGFRQPGHDINLPVFPR